MLRKSQAGVSIVEVLIATMILFMVLTAVMGVLGMTYFMSATARSQSSATAFVNTQIEDIRAMPYTNIGTQGGDPNGTLAANETTVQAGVTYTISRSITWVDDPMDNSPQTEAGADSDRHDYKSVLITLSWVNPASGATTSITSATMIREPWVDTNAPNVEFTANNVPSNSIVYAGSVFGGGPASLQARADDNLDGDGKIASLVFYVDGRVVKNGSATAYWAPDQKEYTNPLFAWDTLALDESGTVQFYDGIRELKVEAWDNSGARDFKIINVTIDNYAPAIPTDLASVVSTANGTCFDTVNLSWTPVMDGTDWATGYQVARTKNGAADGTFNVAGTLSAAADGARTSFSKYSYSMRSVSPRGLLSDWTSATADVITKPKLTGTAGGSGSNRTAILSWTPPTFAATGIHYHICQATTWSGGNITTEVLDQYYPTTWTSASFNKSLAYYWQINARYDIGGGVYVSVYSNVIGPSPARVGDPYPTPP